MELAVVVGLIAVLAGIAIPMWKGWRERVMVKKASDDITAMSVVIDAYFQDTGRFPATLADVKRDTLRDPWGRAYSYLNLQTSPPGQARKDHSLVPLNTDYDLYSSGPDGSSSPPLTAQASRDDILRANNGRFVGPASSY